MMTTFFVLAVAQNTSWYVFPLAAAISLVYSASRYELPERVILRSIRLFLTIIGFMLAVLLLLWFLSASL